MKFLCRSAVTSLLLITVLIAVAQGGQVMPGLQPYTPSRIEWLALESNVQLKQDLTVDTLFSLNVVGTGHDTLLIFVRYYPSVDREIMNKAVESAREIIKLTAKSHGWEKWVQIKERVEMIKRKAEGAGN